MYPISSPEPCVPQLKSRFVTLLRQIYLYAFPAINTLRPRQNGRRFADDTFKCIFLNENVRISIKISLKFIPKGPINNYSIGSDNGLALSRRQSIIWTNDG